MIDNEALTRVTPASAAVRGNPYAIGLTAVGGFAWVLAYMLWIVLAQVTDYATYDLDTASALTAWCYVLVGGGAAAIVAAVAILGVRHELRHSSRRG